MKKALLFLTAKTLFLLFFLSLTTLRSFSQSGSVTISQNVPTSVTVCGSTAFSLNVKNITGSNLSGLLLNISMPGGVNYIPGSISSIPSGVTQSNISNLQSPIFTVPTLGPFAFITIAFEATVDCNIIAYQSGGNPIVNIAKITYPNLTTDQNTSITYNVNAPSLAISTFINQTFTAIIGTTFTRSITITNSGSGSLSSFVFTDIHGNEIDIFAATPGTLSGNITNDTVKISGGNFTTVGDNDSLFENGESITIVESIKILKCSQTGVPSSIKAVWSCNSQTCQTITTTANITVPPAGTPELVITPTESFETCLDNTTAREQSLSIVNNGSGPANNIFLDIYQGHFTSPNSNYVTRIDENSFTYQIGINGTPTPLAADSALNNNPYLCLGPVPKYYVYLHLPVYISPVTDTVYLKWNSFACCQSTSCDSSFLTAVAPWEFKGRYTDACDTVNVYDIFPTAGGDIYGRYLNTSMAPEDMPTDISDGSTSTFEHLVTNWQNELDSSPGAYYQVQVTIPPCFTLAAGASSIRFRYNPNGTLWLPTSPITISGNVATAIFATPDPFGVNGLSQASLLFDLVSDCSSCPIAQQTGQSVAVDIKYNPDPSCSNPCLLKVYCNSNIVNLHCGSSDCPGGGINFVSYKMERTSYGLPDNNDDGLPEAGSVNLSLIKTRRAMTGDTLTGYFKGLIDTSLANPTFSHVYASATINNLGTYITFIDANVRIYDASTGTTYSCNNVPPLSSAPSGNNFVSTFDVSPSYLNTNGCGIPPGFLFEEGDSVLLNHRYKVTGNTGGTVVSSNTTTDFYASNVPNPPPNPVPADRFTCDNFSGNYLSLYGFYFASDTIGTYVAKSCNTPTVRNTNLLSIGPCCQNYGSNKFPFEYRPWANIDTVKVVIPFGYDYVSATANGIGQSTTVINPLNPLSDTLIFDMGALYTGGTWPNYSFDGYHNTVQVKLTPTCNVTNSILNPVKFDETHEKVPFIGGGYSTVSLTDFIAYTAPVFNIQSTLQTVDGIDNIESWEITVCNLSNNSTANNSWLSFVSPNSNISVIDVIDTTTHTIVPSVGGIYQIGSRPFNSCATYAIRFTYSACSKDSLIVNAGWNCSGYPPSLSAYPCVPKTYPLFVDPKPAGIQMLIAGPARDTVNLCDTTRYQVTINSVLVASVYNIVVKAALPSGMSIVPGTSEILYPETPVVWSPISDPVADQWHLSDSVLQLASGLPGAGSPAADQLRIRFKIRPDCGYISGSTVPFSTTSTDICGQSLPTQYATSGPLYIQGVEQLNVTTTNVTINPISPCGSPSLVKVRVLNVGPTATTGNEHFNFPLNTGANYVPGSFVGLHNPPPIAIPSTASINGENYMDWQFPVGVAPLDTVVFNFFIQVNPDSVNCSSVLFPVKTTGAFSATCIADNSICIIRAITSAAAITVPVNKPCLTVTALDASSQPAGGGENMLVDYTVFNSCGDKATGLPVTVYFYFDNDNNGLHSPGDTLIGTNTFTDSLLSNTGNTYNNVSFFTSTVASCSILAVIDTSFNSCTCANSLIASTIPLLNAGLDSSFCSGDSLTIGLAATTGYTYLWAPVTGLSNTTASSTKVTLTNISSAPVTHVYTLTTDRGACVSVDTVNITVNPIPSAIATPTSQTFCSGDSTSIALSSNTTGSTFSWVVNQSGVTGATADSGAVIIQTLLTTGSVAGTATYTITPSANGCAGSSVTASITVNPVDASAAFNYTSGTYCQSGSNQTPTINGLPGGTFTFTPGGLIINSSTGTINLSASTLGTYLVTYTTTGICPKMNTVAVTITNVTPSAAFSYPNSSYCPNGSNPLPVFASGASAGIFTATPSGLVFVNSNTGQIDLTLSTPGTYTVINTIPASGSCLAATATSTITIALDDASFVYTSATYCLSGTDPTPTVTGLAGGTFSATPSGLSINPSTGVIDLSASTVAAYTLSYTTNGNCPNTSSILMTIDSVSPSAVFSYSNSTFCQNSNNPLPIYAAGGSAGIYTASPAGMAFVHINTGEIDLALSTPGTYTVTNTIPASGTCFATFDTTTVVITSADNASFSYASGTYCTSGTNPTPAVTGISGGTFSSSPAGLSINASTGTINLATSLLGAYAVMYTTNGTCPNSSSLTITIGNTTPSATFAYSGSSFCQNGGNPTPIFASGASAGTFSATPAGLSFVNTTTGEINMSQSLLGTYTIVNTIPASGSCLAVSATTTFSIVIDDASFTYTSATYCQSGTNPTPTITGLPGGTFSSVPTGLVINPTTGTINLSTSALGTYTLSYTTNGLCSSTSSITMTIGNTNPVATYSYSNASFCQNGTDPYPVFASGASAGIFSAVPSGLSFVHVNTGQIDLSTSTPGTYTVTNAIPASGSCLATFASTTVIITPSDNASFHYSSGTYCQSGGNQTPVITGVLGGTFSAVPAGLSVDTLTGVIDLASSSLGVYMVSYTTSGACQNTSSLAITIANTTPPANFNYSGSPFCQSGNNPYPVFGTGASAGVFSAVPAGLVFVNVNTGEIDLTLSAQGTYTITNTIPTSGTCLATSAVSTITIGSGDASFIYSSGFYCQSGTNPSPIIIGLTGGTFSASPAGLVVNASTGLIDLATSSLGTYTLTYTTNGVCPGSSSMPMTIGTVTPSASFSYLGSQFCQNGQNPYPQPGSYFGVFSATPNGLSFVNLNTGEINLTQSVPGTYAVTNTIPASGTCLEASATTVVIITPADNASFTYSSATYCESGANPTPVITGLTGGYFSASPAGLSINPATGTINLAASALNIYTLSYTTNGVCPNTTSITMTITNVTPSADFSYAGSPFCQYGNDPYPQFIQGASAGLFLANPAGLVFVHVNTGQIDLSASLPGTYTVFNTIPVSGSCLSASASYIITIDAAPVVTASVSTLTVCNGGTATISLTSSQPGTSYVWSVSQAGVSGAVPGTGPVISTTLTLTGTNGGSATYTITPTANGCTGVPIIVPVTISPLPTLNTSAAIITPANCQDSTGSVQGIAVVSGYPAFQYEWRDSAGVVVGNAADLNNVGTGIYLLTVTDANGCTTSSSTYTITSTTVIVAAFSVDTTTGETPLTVSFINTSTNAVNYLWQFGTGDTSTAINPTYTYIPTGDFSVCLMADNGGGCMDTSCMQIEVFVNSVFVLPNVFSPNGDDVNDVFAVQGKGLEALDGEIYNRWGQKLFEWHSVSGGWDGRSASGLLCPEGTYYFVISATGKDGKNYYERGAFSLVH
ncbi:MAG: gliding motility-associated C-terminal domain-containing protein [Bacteroidota bacterium]